MPSTEENDEAGRNDTVDVEDFVKFQDDVPPERQEEIKAAFQYVLELDDDGREQLIDTLIQGVGDVFEAARGGKAAAYTMVLSVPKSDGSPSFWSVSNQHEKAELRMASELLGKLIEEDVGRALDVLEHLVEEWPVAVMALSTQIDFGPNERVTEEDLADPLETLLSMVVEDESD